MNLSQLMAAELPPVRYIVKGLLTPGCVILAAKPKVGKSGFVLRLCIEVAAGLAFLGRFATVATDVLYIAYEDEPGVLQKRAMAMLRKLGIRPPKRLEIQTDWPTGPEGGYARLEEILEDCGGDLRLVVIDDLRHFHPLVRSYNADNKIIERIDELGRKYGACIVVVLHQGKGRVANNQNWSWSDRIQGSGTGAARIIMGLEREEGVEEGVLRVTGKAVPEQALPLKWDGASGLWEVLETTSAADLTEMQAETVEIVRKWPGRKANELARMANREFEALRQMLRYLAERGHLSAIERRYYASETVAPWTTEAVQTDLDDLMAINGHVVKADFPAAEAWSEDGLRLTALDPKTEEWLRVHGGAA